jgi:hypothetical protein
VREKRGGKAMFDVDTPVYVRDESIRLLEFGARVARHIAQHRPRLARVPQLLNEAVIGVAAARQRSTKEAPRTGTRR